MNNKMEKLIDEIMIEKKQLKEKEEYFNHVSNSIINILKETIYKIELDNELIVSDILSEMIDEIRKTYPLSGINGERILVKDTVRDLIKCNEKYKNYPIDEDRLEWILREFHDSYFDYDNFEKGVIEAMKYVEENYEE